LGTCLQLGQSGLVSEAIPQTCLHTQTWNILGTVVRLVHCAQPPSLLDRTVVEMSVPQPRPILPLRGVYECDT
jgi:hypothetical protein